MIPPNGIISAIVFAVIVSIVKAGSNVPVYMWNIDTDAVVNPLMALTAEDLVQKVSPALNHKLVVMFMQDELSVNDFKSGDLNELKSVAEGDNDGTFYAPSVTGTRNLPGELEAAGFKVIQVKSSSDLPTSTIVDKTVLVVELPATPLDGSRSEALQLNGDVVREIYEVLKSQQPDVLGIFTAKRNSQLLMDESKIRIRRAAPLTRDGNYGNDFLNVSGQIFLYFEKAPTLRVGKYLPNGNPPKYSWGNFTLDTTPDTTGSVGNATNAVLVLTYGVGNSSSGSSSLTSAKFQLAFSVSKGYWNLNSASVAISANVEGQSVVDTFSLTPTDISTPSGSSYHCTPTLRLAEIGFSRNFSAELGTKADYMISFEPNGFQLQPFNIKLNRFGDWWDCQGFFTEGIWAAILVGLVLAMMLAWAVSMVADIKAPDRFDDPKGKTITITATD